MNIFSKSQSKILSSLKNVRLVNLLANKQSLYFVIVNILIAFIGFIRSFAFIKFLNFSELGLITLIQTGAMLIGFFQIGLINGGYRILAIQNAKSTTDTNNVIFSFIGILSVLLIFFFLVATFTGLIIDRIIVGLSIITGLFLLLNNWLSNTLIAGREYKRINLANLISAFISLGCLPLAYYYGVTGGAISIFIQPLVFVIFVFFSGKNVWPSQFIINTAKIKYILHYGFIPFLAGIFFLSYIQIERWSVAAFLGTAALGNLYLVFLVSSLWVLIPTSILNLFFPRAAKYYDNDDFINFNYTIRKHFTVILSYSLIAVLVIVFLFQPVVNWVFPKHSPFVKFALLALPGLVFRTLTDPIALVLNSIVKLKPIFWSDLSGLVLYFMLICTFAFFNLFNLFTVVLCFNIYFGYKFLFLFITYVRFKRLSLF